MNSIWESYGGQWGIGDWTVFADGMTGREHQALWRIQNGSGSFDDMLVAFYGPALRKHFNQAAHATWIIPAGAGVQRVTEN